MGYFTRRLTSLRFEDSVGLGMTIGPGDGDLSIGFVNAENAEHQAVNDRDQHDGFTLGADLVQECQITVRQRNEALSHAVQQRILDFLRKKGAFAAAQSIDDTVWSWKAIATFDDGAVVGTVTLPKCRGGFTFSEGQPANTFVVQFSNYLAPVYA